MVHGLCPGLGKHNLRARCLVGAYRVAAFRPDGTADLVTAELADAYRRFFLVGVDDGDDPGACDAIIVSGFTGNLEEHGCTGKNEQECVSEA